MEFKIDTKNIYTLITPLTGTADVNLAAQIADKCAELTSSGSQHFIIDLSGLEKTDGLSFDVLTKLHESSYEAGRSLVFTGLAPELLAQIGANAFRDTLNFAPTLEEAVDIVSMEILERDLLGDDPEA